MDDNQHEVLTRATKEILLDKEEEDGDFVPEEKPSQVLEKQLKNFTILLFMIAGTTGVITSTLYPNTFYLKDIISAEAYEITMFRSISSLPWSIKPFIGYVEDVIYPFTYRIKSWIVISCFVSITGCSLIGFLKPKTTEMTWFFFMINFAGVMQDVIAQGLTVIILNLHKSKAEAIARENRAITKEIILQTEKGTEIGKKVYGNYVLGRFILRTTATFVGGVLSKKIDFYLFYAAISVVQVLMLFYVLFIFKEDSKKSLISSELNFLKNIKGFWGAISGLDTLLPLIITVVILITPNISDPGTYILVNIKKWKPFDLSLATLISGIFYYLSMMFVLNKAKGLKLPYMMLIAVVASNITNVISFQFTIYDVLHYGSLFSLYVVNYFCSTLSVDFLLIPIVGRFSLKCPKGIESFGVTALAAIVNFSGMSAGVLGSKVLQHFHVEKDQYENLIYPTEISFGYGLFALALLPIFAK